MIYPVFTVDYFSLLAYLYLTTAWGSLSNYKTLYNTGRSNHWGGVNMGDIPSHLGRVVWNAVFVI